jgi:histidine ammonia-lyase
VGSQGQIASADNLRRLLADSAINLSHANCGRVQDAYSMRCAAQVHGAAREAFRYAHQVFDAEANAATDNPMVFADTGEIISGGNFHGAPVAVAADVLCLGLAQLATISERRSDSPRQSGIERAAGIPHARRRPPVRADDGAGHAAALTSELKTTAHPSSVDTIPTSGNREDHVSMSMGAALKAFAAVELGAQVVAIELLCAAQAHDPVATARELAAARARPRATA